jgi:hypothetical protein
MDNFLSSLRFFQMLTATMIKGIWSHKSRYSHECMAMLTKTFTSRQDVIQLIEQVHNTRHAKCVIWKDLAASKDHEFIDVTNQNQLQASAAVLIKE